jgi:excisionase family DNA binding protein
VTIWLTVLAASEVCAVSVPTLRREIEAGRLQAYRIGVGRLIRIRRDDLDAWLSARGPMREAA